MPKTIDHPFTVQANKPWQNTGIKVQSNDLVRYDGGTWCVSPGHTKACGPDGVHPPIAGKASWAVPNVNEGALVGMVGTEKFFLGSVGASIPPSVTKPGILFLAANDDMPSTTGTDGPGAYGQSYLDNTGSLQVTIQLLNRGGTS